MTVHGVVSQQRCGEPFTWPVIPPDPLHNLDAIISSYKLWNSSCFSLQYKQPPQDDQRECHQSRYTILLTEESKNPSCLILEHLRKIISQLCIALPQMCYNQSLRFHRLEPNTWTEHCIQRPSDFSPACLQPLVSGLPITAQAQRA